MKKTASALCALVTLTLAPGSSLADEDALRDPKNMKTKVDVRRAWLDHTEERIRGRIRTRQEISDTLLATRGFFRFHFWQPSKQEEGTFAVAIFRRDNDLKARVFRIEGGEAKKELGFTTVAREAPNEFSFSVARKKLNVADESHIKWTAFGYWCSDESCEKPKIDWIPNAGGENHFLP